MTTPHSASSGRLADFILAHPKLMVLTGAGCSTASGIPDYRDHDGEWKHPRPVQFQDFLRDPAVRRRYWGRGFVGWQRIAHAAPNAAHRALAQLEAAGRLSCLVTQNVDGLHQSAGSRRVIDLHGRLDRVRCLGCDALLDRHAVQRQMQDLNPHWRGNGALAPDGDVHLDDVDYDTFRLPECLACGGVLKPDVVFFGENVPPGRVVTAFDELDLADALLVVGSSMMVFSGFRFARAAAESGKPIALVNLGRTRADELVSLRVEADCNKVLPETTRLVHGTARAQVC